MRLRFQHSIPETNNISSFFFKPETEFNYTAGQYVELTLEHKHPDNRGIKRWFTLSSSPNDALLSITTKIDKDKSSSFKTALTKLQPDDELNMTGPMGDFVLPKILQTPLLFVAGGVGITPFHSILSWLSSTKEERPIKVIYAVKDEEEILFLETFHKANQHVSVIVGNPSPSWGGERGTLSANLILGLTSPTPESLIFVSGPEPMVEKLETDLKNNGIKQSQLVLDFFPNYPDY